MKGREINISIDDVARICGVSITTVSRVINEKENVSEETRALIKKTISKLGYVPSGAARRMASTRPYDRIPTQTIAIIGSKITMRSVYAAEILAVLSDRSLNHGYRLAIEFDTGARLSNYDGVILMEGARDMPETAVPCVTVGWFSPSQLIPGVMPDWETGTYQALRIALSKGYTKPLLLTGSSSSTEQSFDSMLYKGFDRAVREEGMETDGLVFEESIHRRARGYEVAKMILQSDRRPDLIVANDDTALGVYRAAAELRVSIPRDLGVIGCDGVGLCEYLNPPLSTVSVDYEGLGEEVLKRFIPVINKTAGPHPQKLLMPVRFVERQSIQRSLGRAYDA